MNKNYIYNVRVTGILIQEDQILLVKQRIAPDRYWSLPGGRVKIGESLEDSIVREMQEETGLAVKCNRLLYVCEKLDTSPPILHISFLLDKVSGSLELPTNEHDENPISNVKFVKIDLLEEYGFSKKFKDIVLFGFPSSGSYMGDKRNIGL